MATVPKAAEMQRWPCVLSEALMFTVRSPPAVLLLHYESLQNRSVLLCAIFIYTLHGRRRILVVRRLHP